MTPQTELAPRYRYFTADLLSNRILQEIPFQGVSYGRALNEAGTFSGQIPVTEETESLNLYESTTPGVTALYVVRNDVCVWGGIVWTRSYDAVERLLSVSASEFPSYLHHRFIWKTWSHQHGASVTITPGSGKVLLDYGSTAVISAGSSVHLEFYEPSNFRYNGYYRVSGDPAPTSTGFHIVGGHSLIDITSVSLSGGVAYFYSDSPTGFNTGDEVVVSGIGAPYDGTHVISNSSPSEQVFQVEMAESDRPHTDVTSASASRPLPEGDYTRVTVTVHTDTYDYIRNLLTATFNDFVGQEFPNDYLEPGISYALPMTELQITNGVATVGLSAPHNLVGGQAVQIQDYSPQLDGEYFITDIPNPTSFRFSLGGSVPYTSVTPATAEVVSAKIGNGLVTITTADPHGFIVGQYVSLYCGFDLDLRGDLLNGTFKITEVPSGTTFKYEVMSVATLPDTALFDSKAVVGGDESIVTAVEIDSNVVTVTTAAPHGFETSDSVTLSNVPLWETIVQKSLEAVSDTATITTQNPHGFEVGTSVTIEGVRDASSVVKKKIQSNKVTLSTSSAHNFVVGDDITVVDLVDEYLITKKQLSSNVATLTTKGNHNLGSEITVHGLYDTNSVTSVAIKDGVASLTVGSHNFKVNDMIEVSAVPETATVISKEIFNGVATLTFSAPHNFLETQEIKVSGVGTPFNGTHTVLSYTDTRVVYELPEKYAKKNVALASSTGTVTSPDSIVNGQFYLSDVDATTISYHIDAADSDPRAVTKGEVRGWSIFNGTFTKTGSTATTVSYTLSGNNVAQTDVKPPVDVEEPMPLVSQPSILLGAHTLTAVTRGSVTFNQTITNNEPESSVSSGQITADSIFNGTHTITAVSDDTFSFTLAAPNNVLEEPLNTPSFAYNTSELAGTYTITGVPSPDRFTFALTYKDLPRREIYGLGEATVTPVAVISTFGPYPGNANLGIEFSSREYSGVNLPPVSYRGFQLTNVGQAIDTYADSINGFEYRIDCWFDTELGIFRKTFVMLPINIPNPPPPGETSPPSRYGADKLVFEFPGGSITSFSVDESVENSATRFFAQGATDLGPDLGPNMSVAIADELLAGTRGDGRRWPLLDATERVDGVDNEELLYAFSKRYLSESIPPMSEISMAVNGSIPPLVGTYAPGDWCTINVNDEFVRMRLASGYETREEIIRKIVAYSVTVPDGTTFPETVSLTVVPEWEVDRSV